MPEPTVKPVPTSYKRVCPDCVTSQAKDFLSERFELHCEVAHKFGFPYDLHATGDFVTTVIHVLERSGNHIHMVVGVSAAADAETQEVVSAETVLTGYGITVGKDVADFAATHA